tara:strand:+ start:1167 stop:2357 length:1191 start_codon:yes stop_codon:yes gene_type:complete
MNQNAATAIRQTCPTCGHKARRVSLRTIRSLLKELAASGFQDGESCCQTDGTRCHAITEDTGWRFCDSPACDVVYFAEQSGDTFVKSQLKVVVGVKETAGDRPLCYCFDHSVTSIKRELEATGVSTAVEDIRSRMNGEACHCEVTNPSGSCCLGSVAKGIEIAKGELAATESHIGSEPPSGRGEKIAKVGTIVSAIMASSCCWLPLVLLAVGVSGAGIATVLETYRPLFMLITFGFLGAAFYFNYRPRPASDANQDASCCDSTTVGESQCCTPKTTLRWSMAAMNKVMLWGVTLLAIAFLAFPSYVGLLFGAGNNAVVTDDMNRAVLVIEGMTCEGCATTVSEAIKSVDGVIAVEVNYEIKQAIIGANICCPVPIAKIKSALAKVGYAGEPIDSTE